MQVSHSLFQLVFHLTINRNVYWTTNPRANGISVLHGVYGLGAFGSPLICQTILARGYSWRDFFHISIAVAGSSVLYCLWAFYPTQEEWEAEKEAVALAGRIGDTACADNKFSGRGAIENACSPVAELSTANKIGVMSLLFDLQIL